MLLTRSKVKKIKYSEKYFFLRIWIQTRKCHNTIATISTTISTTSIKHQLRPVKAITWTLQWIIVLITLKQSITMMTFSSNFQTVLLFCRFGQTKVVHCFFVLPVEALVMYPFKHFHFNPMFLFRTLFLEPFNS